MMSVTSSNLKHQTSDIRQTSDARTSFIWPIDSWSRLVHNRPLRGNKFAKIVWDLIKGINNLQQTPMPSSVAMARGYDCLHDTLAIGVIQSTQCYVPSTDIHEIPPPLVFRRGQNKGGGYLMIWTQHEKSFFVISQSQMGQKKRAGIWEGDSHGYRLLGISDLHCVPPQ